MNPEDRRSRELEKLRAETQLLQALAIIVCALTLIVNAIHLHDLRAEFRGEQSIRQKLWKVFDR